MLFLGTLKLAGKLTVYSRLVVRQHRALSITGSHRGFIVTKRVGVGVYRPLQLSEGRGGGGEKNRNHFSPFLPNRPSPRT